MPRRNNRPSRPSAEDWRLLLSVLAAIEQHWTSGAYTERDAMAQQLESVALFLPWGYHSLLYKLSRDLTDLRYGFQVPYLKADKKNKGRKRDSLDIQYLKGELAGVACLQMEAGMSRHAAAKWVANKISPPGTRHETNVLASRVASRPVTTRTVLQWMDDYDCGSQCDMEDESTRKDFERAIDVIAEDEADPLARFRRQCDFLHAHTPRKKWGNFNVVGGKVHGIFGWLAVMYWAAEFQFSCEDILKTIGERVLKQPAPE
jgi:hypothetical protein